MPPLGQLLALLGLPRISPTRIAAGIALLIVTTALIIAGFVELIDGVRAYLGLVLTPAAATLATSLCIFLFAAITGLAAYRLTRPRPRRPRSRASPGPGASEQAAAALGWVQGHPKQATLIAAILGFCTGALPEARAAVHEATKPQD